MILRRAKKKKQKKALLEAQQAAAMQNMLDRGYNTLPTSYLRPHSSISMPGDENDLYNSGSDELEIGESMSFVGEMLRNNGPDQGSLVNRRASPPSAQPMTNSLTQSMTVPYSPQTFAQIQPPAVYTARTPNDHVLRRGSSQPVIMTTPAVLPTASLSPIHGQPPSLPTTIHEYITPTTTKETLPVPQTPATTAAAVAVSSATNSSNNTLPRSGIISSKRYNVVKIDPAKADIIKTSIALGLGRGIDATNKSPWMNKSPFQIRRIHNSIMETNEGNAVGSYQEEILSISDMDELFASSLNPPEAPVIIHVEADANRRVNYNRQAIGKKVVTRTIAFQTDTEEKYLDGESPNRTSIRDVHAILRDPSEVVYNTQNSALTFEERICYWLLHRIAHKCYQIGQRLEIRNDDSPAEQLTRLLHSTKSLVKMEDEIKSGCKEIINALRVTHYITSIKLGAGEYRIMSDGEYHKQMARGGAFGLDMMAEASSNEFTDLKQSKKEATKMQFKVSHMRKIGRINEENKVEQGSPDEVVLMVKVQPITRLIRIPTVKRAMKVALEAYMERTAAAEGGPFVIKCTGKDLYLTVNKYNNYEVEGTDVPGEASLFYFHSTDDGHNPFDFHIAYYGEDVGPDGQKHEGDIARYLEAKVNVKGSCPGPLLMKHSVKVRNTRFTLRSRLSKKSSKSHISSWINGEDAYYIACSTRKFQHDSYLGVKSTDHMRLLGKHFFMTECMSSIHMHNGTNTFMLFQLLPKETLLEKTEEGRETPGKLPVQPTEITIRNGQSKTITTE
jgi:hypothetical protein